MKYLGIKEEVLDTITINLKQDTACKDLTICNDAREYWNSYLGSTIRITTDVIKQFLKPGMSVVWWLRDIINRVHNGNDEWEYSTEEGREFRKKYWKSIDCLYCSYDTRHRWTDPDQSDIKEVQILTYWTKAILLRRFLTNQQFSKLTERET